MAGSFFHLWLAREAYPVVAAQFRGERSALQAAFAAGALAPDIGFFPGGPRRFSERVHHERAGEFLRAMQEEVHGDVEGAFVAGWALHIYTDAAIHPLVNERVAAFLEQCGSAVPRRPDLWHKRLELGIDCHLLERSEMRFLWNVRLHFPSRAPAPVLWAQVGMALYGREVRPAEIEHGGRSLQKWVARIPALFLWCGNTTPSRYRSGAGFAGRCLRPLAHGVLGKWFEGLEVCEDAAALARPWRPEKVLLAEAGRRGLQVLEDFRRGWSERFAALPNLDLDTGRVRG